MATPTHPPSRSIDFADRRWWVKRSSEPVGPGPNRFDDSTASVEVDPDGELVLRVRRAGGGWVCAEVVGEEATGYGRYEWTVRTDLADLDRHVVLGMFTWSDDPAHHHRELDIEVSAWGRDDGAVGQFVVQPAATPGHLRTFPLPRTATWRCSFDWSPGRLSFRADGGSTWTFTGDGVPTPGGAHPRINLWLFRGSSPADDAPATVTIGGFRFAHGRRDGRR